MTDHVVVERRMLEALVCPVTQAQLTWDAAGFVPAGSALVLATPTATGTLTFANAIALGGNVDTVRTLQVEDGTATVDAVMTGAGNATDPTVTAVDVTGRGTPGGTAR